MFSTFQCNISLTFHEHSQGENALSFPESVHGLNVVYYTLYYGIATGRPRRNASNYNSVINLSQKIQ